MRHKNTVFRDVLKLVPWVIFDRLVERHGSDEFVRKLTTRHQLIALLYGQFAGADSLREIITALKSHRARLYMPAARFPCRSTLAARFSAEVCGAKAHIVYDPDLACPVYHAVTAALEAGATYVFGLGYYDYAWWAKLDAACCRIVTRFKSNTPLIGARDCKLDAGAGVLYDRIGFLPAKQRAARIRCKLRCARSAS